MTPNELRNDLRAGKKIFGTLIVSPSPRWPDAVRDIGLDFVFIDTEHIAIGRIKFNIVALASYLVRSEQRRAASCESI